jgi:hypothetical protein
MRLNHILAANLLPNTRYNWRKMKLTNCLRAALGATSPSLQYMKAAVQAHENVHAGDWEAAMDTAFTTMKAAVESLTTPFECSDSPAAAQGRMQSAADAAISDAYCHSVPRHN